MLISTITGDSSIQPLGRLSRSSQENYAQTHENSAERAAFNFSITEISSEEYQRCCKFFYRFKPLIKSKLKYFKCSSELLEDLLQEGYLALWQTILNSKKSNTLNRDVRLAINARMQAFWRKQINFSNSINLLIDEPIFIDDSIEQIEIIDALLKAIDSLSEKRKEIILQRYFLSNNTNITCTKKTPQAKHQLFKNSLEQLSRHPEIVCLRSS
jgi:DNA-directed RNA polymerase specialized sigma subunit